MSLAPWRSPLSRALHRNRSNANSRYPQLATVRPNGRPANRTIVFRDFWGETDQLLFVTDMRSEKIEQIATNPQAELCWYFTSTREQFRMGGRARAIDPNSADDQDTQVRNGAWEDLSEKSKQQFIWPTPGDPRTHEGYEFVEGLDKQPPPETFAVLVFDADTVDHLELKGDPQNRYQYWRLPDHSWKTLEVNP
jgi:PPOX class probable FMN-dependent enzyme